MTTKKKNNCRNGAAVVEAALMLPLLVITTFGAIDVAQYINAAQVVSSSSREGARIASRSSTVSAEEVKDCVLEYLADAFPNLSEDELDEFVDVQTRKMSHPNTDLADGSLASVDSGDTIFVSVELNFDEIRWISFVPGFNQLSTSTYCRRE